MNKYILLVFASITLGWNCSSQNSLFPAAFKYFDQFKKENTIITGTPEAQRINKVGENLVQASRKFLNANGYPDYLEPFEFEFIVVKDGSANAWALPGGKIVFYTGILPAARSETGIAAIMSHLFGHLLTDHGAQRMSTGQQKMLLDAGSKDLNESHRQILAQAYGLDTEGVALPFDATHEGEADRIGLTIMAIAGYDPTEAAQIWTRLEENSTEFPSTHPTDFSSLQNIRSWAPQAKEEALKYGTTFN